MYSIILNDIILVWKLGLPLISARMTQQALMYQVRPRLRLENVLRYTIINGFSFWEKSVLSQFSNSYVCSALPSINFHRLMLVSTYSLLKELKEICKNNFLFIIIFYVFTFLLVGNRLRQALADGKLINGNALQT